MYKHRVIAPHSLEEACLSSVSVESGKIFAGIILSGTIFASQEKADAADLTSQFNIHTQTACEAEMLSNMGAHEVFSGKAYDLLTEVARAYARAIPHI
jgi:hypothetical protein